MVPSPQFQSMAVREVPSGAITTPLIVTDSPDSLLSSVPIGYSVSDGWPLVVEHVVEVGPPVIHRP